MLLPRCCSVVKCRRRAIHYRKSPCRSYPQDGWELEAGREGGGFCLRDHGQQLWGWQGSVRVPKKMGKKVLMLPPLQAISWVEKGVGVSGHEEFVEIALKLLESELPAAVVCGCWQIGKEALKTLERHLWYLSDLTVPMALFSEKVDPDINRQYVRKITS